MKLECINNNNILWRISKNSPSVVIMIYIKIAHKSYTFCFDIIDSLCKIPIVKKIPLKLISK